MEREAMKKESNSHIKSFEAFSFDFEGTDIRNPFTDETARQDVEPKQYYGKDYAKSDIKKIIDASEEFISKYLDLLLTEIIFLLIFHDANHYFFP